MRFRLWRFHFGRPLKLPAPRPKANALIAEAEELAMKGHYMAAVLVGGVALENALIEACEAHSCYPKAPDGSKRKRTPNINTLLMTLLDAGKVNKHEVAFLKNGSSSRNRAAHGKYVTPTDALGVLMCAREVQRVLLSN